MSDDVNQTSNYLICMCACTYAVICTVYSFRGLHSIHFTFIDKLDVLKGSQDRSIYIWGIRGHNWVEILKPCSKACA